MAFGRPFNHPFREAQPVTALVGFPVSLDGRGYLIDRKQQFVRRQVQLLRTQANPQTNESVLLPPEVWRRARESWHMGAGQRMGDREESLPYRFRDSIGVNVWDKWQLGLLHRTTPMVPSSETSIFLTVLGDHLVMGAGDELTWVSDPLVLPTVQTFPALITSLTADGEGVIVGLANGDIRKATNPGTQALLCTLPSVSFVAYAKDRLVACAVNSIYDITNITDGAAVVLGTPRIPDPLVHRHPLAGFRWVGAAEGLSCIYLLGGVGDRWVVHRLMLKDDATGLNPPIVSTQLPEGEIGTALGGYLGYLFVGTQFGLRFGVPAANGDVTLGSLIPTAERVNCFEGQGRFVWYGNSNFQFGATGLGRVDLTTFTQPLTPAYANDLHLESDGEVTAVTTWQGRRVFAVAEFGLLLETDEFVTEGRLTSGEFTYGVSDRKIAMYAQMRFFAPLHGKVFLDVTYDAPDTWREAGRWTVPGQLQGENAYLNGAEFVKLETRLRLQPTLDLLASPEVSRWEIRAVPVSGRASEWVVPILLSDVLDVNGVQFARDPAVDRDRLLALVESSRVFTYREGTQAWLVNALDFEWRAERETFDSSHWAGVFTIRLRELR